MNMLAAIEKLEEMYSFQIIALLSILQLFFWFLNKDIIIL